MLPILSLVIGLSAAMAAREQILRDGSLFGGVHLVGVILTCTAAIVPLGVYLFLVHPAWSMLYWFEPLDISGWHVLWVALGAPAAGALGYLGGGVLCRKINPRATLIASALGLAGLVVCLALVGDRLVHLSADTDWQQAPSILAGNLTAVFAFSLPVLLAAWTFLVLLYEVEGRKLQRASGVRLAAGAALAAARAGPGPGESLVPGPDSQLAIPDLRSSAEMAAGQPSGGGEQKAGKPEGDGDPPPADPAAAQAESSPKET